MTIPSHEIEACDPTTCEKCLEEIEKAQVEEEVAFHHAAAIAEIFEALRQEITTVYLDTRERWLFMTKLDEAELWLTRCKEE